MQTDFAYDEGAPLAPAPGVIMHEAPRYRTPPPARARRPPWSLRGLEGLRTLGVLRAVCIPAGGTAAALSTSGQ